MSDPKSTALAVRNVKLPAAAAQAKTEAKTEKFIRLANGRAGEAIQALERLGNLGTPAYEYTDAQVAQLEQAIHAAMQAAMRKLRARTTPKRSLRPIL